MKCHYAVLCVERDATDDQIKKAYRKLALQWHPDKNPDRIEESTEYMAVIQQAYDVLSDPHERAWYDRHREAILRGGLGDHYTDNSINLFPYFSRDCYKGFGNDDKGFYSIYRGVFETLATEDLDFIDKPEEAYFPSFGDKDSNYDETVGPFYAFWQSYSTARSFAWLDKYDIRQAPNRQVVRAMEKENKKLRESAKKERNEEVRELVGFVRKRDKRVEVYRQELEVKRLEQQKKAEEHRINQIRERLSAIGSYKGTAWENSEEHENKLQEIEANLAAQFGYDSENSTENETNSESEPDLYCIACEKPFKTEKAFENHQKSKKHKETVAALKVHMEQDEMFLFEEAEKDEKTDQNVQGGKKSKKQKKKQRQEKNLAAKEEEEKSENDENSETVENGNLEVEKEENLEISEEKHVANGHDASAKSATNKPKVEPTRKAARCDHCSEIFDSRSRLFTHLKDNPGHATLKANVNVGKKPKKNKK